MAPVMNIHITRPRRLIDRNDKNHIEACYCVLIQVLGVLYVSRVVVRAISAAMQSTPARLTWGCPLVLYHGSYMDFLCVEFSY